MRGGPFREVLDRLTPRLRGKRCVPLFKRLDGKALPLPQDYADMLGWEEQVDAVAEALHRNRGVDVGMIGDVSAIIEQMTAEASNHQWKDLPWLEELRAARAAQEVETTGDEGDGAQAHHPP